MSYTFVFDFHCLFYSGTIMTLGNAWDPTHALYVDQTYWIITGLLKISDILGVYDMCVYIRVFYHIQSCSLRKITCAPIPAMLCSTFSTSSYFIFLYCIQQMATFYLFVILGLVTIVHYLSILCILSGLWLDQLILILKECFL